MANPYANADDYQERHALPSGVSTDQVDTLLGDASTVIRAEAPQTDDKVASGAMERDVPRLVAIDMVAEALRRRRVDLPAGATVQNTAGPFSGTVTASTSLPGDLYLSRTMRRRLGIGQRAFNVPMYRVPQ